MLAAIDCSLWQLCDSSAVVGSDYDVVDGAVCVTWRSATVGLLVVLFLLILVSNTGLPDGVYCVHNGDGGADWQVKHGVFCFRLKRHLKVDCHNLPRIRAYCADDRRRPYTVAETWVSRRPTRAVVGVSRGPPSTPGRLCRHGGRGDPFTTPNTLHTRAPITSCLWETCALK